MSESLRLCPVEDIPDGGAKAFERLIAGQRQPLVAVRRGDEVWVYRNRCPHFSVPLDFNPGEFCTYKQRLIMCAHHSAMFRFEDGLCIDGPCTGARLEAVESRVEDGTLCVVEQRVSAVQR